MQDWVHGVADLKVLKMPPASHFQRLPQQVVSHLHLGYHLPLIHGGQGDLAIRGVVTEYQQARLGLGMNKIETEPKFVRREPLAG